MSASASESSNKTDNYSAQTSVQGASGAGSPTTTAGGNVTYTSNDPAIAQSAISAAAAAVTAALSGAGDAVHTALGTLQGQTQAASATQGASADQNNQLVSAVLAQEQQLATAKGTDNASLFSNSLNYIIWIVGGGVVLGILALVFSHRRKEA